MRIEKAYDRLPEWAYYIHHSVGINAFYHPSFDTFQPLTNEILGRQGPKLPSLPTVDKVPVKLEKYISLVMIFFKSDY